MILTMITVGKTLESYSKGKTTNAIKSLMDLAPRAASVLRDGEEIIIPAYGHDWGEWTVASEPTCTDGGYNVRVCARCGEL